VNLQEVAGGKKFLELLLEVVNFTGLPPDKENTVNLCINNINKQYHDDQRKQT